jgi:hypothetical protein
MQLMPIDSAETLEAADLPPGTARAIVRVITDHIDGATSNLATKDEVERLRLDMKSEFERSRLATTNEIQASRSAMKSAIDEFRLTMKKESEAFRSAMTSEFAEFRIGMKIESAEFRSTMRREFDEFRVYGHRSFVKWSMALFGALISSYATLIFIVIQHLQK